MIIRPYGYAVWEAVVQFLDSNIKKLGVENAYFPTFIPESFFRKEAEHAKGFAPEVAWVESKDEGAERLALRPTSETIMYDSYSRWIRSWRDLPLRINQWCNIIRWEVKDVKMFLRSREFLWQEGHCVYRTEEECRIETLLYLEEYRRVVEDLLAIPVIKGKKTEHEKFAGALRTYTIEAFMPDGKALQMGTSHELGQGFAKAFGVKYVAEDEEEHYPWQNSWGLTTRTVGAMIMLHGDDKGLVMPPRAAPIQVVIVPIFFKGKTEGVMSKARELKGIIPRSKLDAREEYSSGWKFNEWELKGVPIRIEIGPRDIEKGQAVMVRRDTGEKSFVPFDKIEETVSRTLDDIQVSLFNKAKRHMEESMAYAEDWPGFMGLIEQRKLIRTNFCGEIECEDTIKTETGGATSRCIPLDSKKPEGKKCVKCGKAAELEVFFAKNY
jgi:prolyl-tRNA synthetase